MRSRHEHPIVARELTFGAQPRCDVPHAGMKPVQGAGDGAEELRDAIQSRDVRQLVEQDHAPPVVRPVRGAGGKENRGAIGAPGHGHRVLPVAQQAHGPSQREHRAQLAHEPDRFWIVDDDRPPGETPQAPVAGADAEEQNAQTGEVYDRQ